MESTHPVYEALLVGAGISGLILGSRLKALGKTTVILEKSRGVGGRLATRRTSECTFDHGAQFIKVRKDQPAPWEEMVGIQTHGRIWFSSADYHHLTFPSGMTELAKHLAQNQDIKFNEKVCHLAITPDACLTETENGTIYKSKKIYLTCPLPQSLELLRHSNLNYPLELESIRYAPALVGLFEVQTEVSKILALDYAQEVSDDVYSVSNQLSKGISKNLAFTVVMQPSWSKAFFEQDEATSLELISRALESYLMKISTSGTFKIVSSQLKKWRYSHPLQTAISPKGYLPINDDIFLLGDAFGGPSIHGAAKSAWNISL